MNARAVAARIIASGLPGGGADVIEPGEDWPELFDVVREQRMTGFAVDAWQRGALGIDEPQAQELLGAHRAAMAWCLHLEAKLLNLAEALERAGIAYVVLKGASLAHTIYPDPSLRSFGDIDLLVASADYYPACDLLGRLGHARQRPEPRPGFEARFGKASVHQHPGDRVEVDLHRALVLGPIGQRVDAEDLLAHTASFQLGGRKLPRLDDLGQFISVAMHAALGFLPARLVPLRDVVGAFGADGLSQSRVRALGAELGLTAVFGFAATSAIDTFGLSPGDPMAAVSGSTPTRQERRELDAYVTHRRRAGALPIATLREVRGFRARAAYARALLVPDRVFMDARSGSEAGGSYGRRWAHVGRRLLERSSRRTQGSASEGRRSS